MSFDRIRARQKSSMANIWFIANFTIKYVNNHIIKLFLIYQFYNNLEENKIYYNKE